ncbi:MAG: UDP-N-acetylmuramate--L-alanine ligase [Varibaculum cambriense]|uniref:UDP-N-acetylmuramate--L-alanine ligase n=1 Tax=Varibaculum cambriense TaxID=184870 RepID=UPI001ECB2BBE|nr:UDP-N-acetylmuramate--L-alanine ligase [Varibaculum cambriense]MBS5918836.1 UDP-N-acetylmuramate--L-alanine ligase [Varibaculum cambriense]
MSEKQYHFIGVGGAGMSVVAQLFVARGWELTGSDQNESDNLDKLRNLGVKCWVGSRPQLITSEMTIVYSSAIRPSNPEFAAAKAAGCRFMHRSQALALAAADRKFVAVAGAHGKTTTSGMLAQTLSQLGADPSFAVGGIVRHYQTGAHLGKGEYFIAEADESDGSFLNYRPQVAIITNIEPDHLDNYGSAEKFAQAFFDFSNCIKPGGTLIVCTDDTGCRQLVERRESSRSHCAVPGIRILGYGVEEPALNLDEFCLIKPLAEDPTSVSAQFIVAGKATTVRLPMPGQHNLLNAAAVFLGAQIAGFSAPEIAGALGDFEGTARRFETKGEAGQIRVIDDYAHHPTEVEALMYQAREAAGGGRVLVLFQPHLYSRTRNFASRFAQALDLADQVVVCDIFRAREDPIAGVTSHLITDKMQRGSYLGDRDEAARVLANTAEPGDLILTVGAGDVTAAGGLILEILASRFAQ